MCGRPCCYAHMYESPPHPPPIPSMLVFKAKVSFSATPWTQRRKYSTQCFRNNLWRFLSFSSCGRLGNACLRPHREGPDSSGRGPTWWLSHPLCMLFCRMLSELSEWFWQERLWFPKGLGWADLEDRDGRVYAKARDLWVALPIALSFLIIRQLFERSVRLW